MGIALETRIDSICQRNTLTDVLDNTDCNDSDIHISNAPELCDGISNTCAVNLPADEIDNDGDGYVECTIDSGGWDGSAITGGEDCDDSDATENPTVTWYADSDGDSYGNPNSSTTCERSNVSDVLNNSDCDDSENTVFPSAPELCDGLANDCNVGIPSNEVDNDGDGYVECLIDSGGWDGSSITGGDDCNDSQWSQVL